VFGREITHAGVSLCFLQVTDITVWLKKPEINTAMPVMKGLLPPVEKELPEQPSISRQIKLLHLPSSVQGRRRAAHLVKANKLQGTLSGQSK
jgi:hypothetical protein